MPLLDGPGEWEFVVAATKVANAGAARATARSDSTIDVFHDGDLTDRVYLGSGGLHVWTRDHPIADRKRIGSKVRIRIAGPAVLRLDAACLRPVGPSDEKP